MQFVSETSRGIYGPSLSGGQDSSPIQLALGSLFASRSEKDHGEGLRRLLGRLSASGHGAIADSWVRTGVNQPILPNQLEEALG
ncbi:MAG: YidB family protein, partial [Microvirga sp.]